NGPFGAKGVGECPIDGPAAAVVNAIFAATGRRLDEIPATPERIMKVMAGPEVIARQPAKVSVQ
ncbi:MAG TPA: hypothetical protein VII38_06575, partial [Polyangia bacterium]